MPKGVVSGIGDGRVRRKVTLREVAALAGVHVSTASRALDTARVGAGRDRDRGAGAERGGRAGVLARSARRGAEAGGDEKRRSGDRQPRQPVQRAGHPGDRAGAGKRDDFVPLVAETGESRERFERLLDAPGRPAGRRGDHLGRPPRRRGGAGASARRRRAGRAGQPRAARHRLRRGAPRRRHRRRARGATTWPRSATGGSPSWPARPTSTPSSAAPRDSATRRPRRAARRSSPRRRAASRRPSSKAVA